MVFFLFSTVIRLLLLPLTEQLTDSALDYFSFAENNISVSCTIFSWLSEMNCKARHCFVVKLSWPFLRACATALVFLVTRLWPEIKWRILFNSDVTYARVLPVLWNNLKIWCLSSIDFQLKTSNTQRTDAMPSIEYLHNKSKLLFQSLEIKGRLETFTKQQNHLELCVLFLNRW